jgi:hypothetical protein
MVDGERLNTSRVAIDRAGVEVGLVDPANLQSVGVISNAMCGTPTWAFAALPPT